ncbi:MAG: DNA polymerase III subunit gamma/tau [Bifidobacteriaceae bacterium]|nr:DNA polymerase III subunit gamma/tau [Bifidobacteriaceae bacterium]
MGLALYRRYRPDTFDGLIGQDQVTVPLMNALNEGRLTHAYLFSGPRGCGKTSSARILARCINCAKGPTAHPCGECESCVELATGGSGSIDVIEIDAASHNSVDDARELRKRAEFGPSRDKYKIFVLDEAHMITPQGFNAMLKLVEEPPEYIIFIFATTEPDKVIDTIRSRTYHYPFRLVPSEIMAPYLQKICEKEQINVESGVLNLVMRAGGGSMRDTLSVLDQLMVGASENTITLHNAVSLLGFTPNSLIEDTVDAVISQNGEQLYDIVQKIVVGGYDPRRFVEDLLAYLRDLLVLSYGGAGAQQALSNDFAQEHMDVLERQAQQLGLVRISELAQTINTVLQDMSSANSPRLLLEILAAQLLLYPAAGKQVPEPAMQSENSFANAGARQVNSNMSGRNGGGFIGNKQQQTKPVQQTASQQAQQQVASLVEAAKPQDQPINTSDSQVPTSDSVASSTAKNKAAQAGAWPEVANVGTAANSAAQSASAPANKIASFDQSDMPANFAQSAYSNEETQEHWNHVLQSLPTSIRAYVDSDHVTGIRHEQRAENKFVLVMTFDSSLSQHAFALGVETENGASVKAVQSVNQAVKKEFGEHTTIAPAGQAANGETVVAIRQLTPEKLAEVKREIALARTKKLMQKSAAQSQHNENNENASKSAKEDQSDQEDTHHTANQDDKTTTNHLTADVQAQSEETSTQPPVNNELVDPWAIKPETTENTEQATQETSKSDNEADDESQYSFSDESVSQSNLMSIEEVSKFFDAKSVEQVTKKELKERMKKEKTE